MVVERLDPTDHAEATEEDVSGFTRFAAPDNIMIVRRDANGERRIPFQYDKVVDDGHLQANLPLQSNDTLVVP